ncbi:hypothetical protein MUU72_27855 [Streptomyces sp. RS10V-4]|uniref:hypothetical protein n=1 Tax=Streptomyces rhizoryzae TaxID=2932493 RepID=UPI00200606B7|nr:hypothetical protein [Streptomyces rhizoryzae]MCK7626869.1 hypothetical protein [Streptomyces rhizoryzae]
MTFKVFFPRSRRNDRSRHGGGDWGDGDYGHGHGDDYGGRGGDYGGRGGRGDFVIIGRF